MTEQHPNTAAKSRHSSMKSRAGAAPYLPSNPSRRRRSIAITASSTCTGTGMADPYSPNNGTQRVKTKSQKLLNRARSIPPRTVPTNHSSTSSLDDVTPSSCSRLSRWESNSSKEGASSKSTGMAMPTRRRGVSPSPPEEDSVASKGSSLPSPAPSKELQQLRRKFSGTAGTPHSSTSTSSTPTATTTTLQSAMHARRTRLMKPRRNTSPSRQPVPTLAASSWSSFSDLAPIDIQSDDDDDHVFVRRTHSNKGLFYIAQQRDEDRTHKQPSSSSSSRDNSRRRSGSDVGPLRIPAVFQQHKKTATSEDPIKLLRKLELLSHDKLGDSLDGLVRALDSESEEDGGLLAFADDESDEEN